MYLIICVLVASLLPVISSPLYYRGAILLIAICLSLIISCTRSLFGIVILLIYVGGMLIAFCYFTSLCPNQIVRVRLVTVIFVAFSRFAFLRDLVTRVTSKFEVVSIYNNFILSSFAVLCCSLFLVMVVVVKIVKIKSGSLRPFITNQHKS